MQRHRRIAAAPERSASESWATVVELVCESVDRSKHLSGPDVADCLELAGGIGRLLIGGGHLDDQGITVIAGDLHLTVTTVSGDAALSLEENLNPVPGAAEAKDWKVYLPALPPLTAAVKDVASKDLHLSSDNPPSASAKARESATEGVLDQGALQDWARSSE